MNDSKHPSMKASDYNVVSDKGAAELTCEVHGGQQLQYVVQNQHGY